MNYPNYSFPNYQQYSNNNNNSSIIWVQGIEGAKAYQLMPNSNCVLMDSDNDGIFYVKISDNIGMCKLRVFKYEEINNTPNNTQIDTSQFVTRDELNKVLESLKGGIKNEQPISTAKKSKSDTKNEQSDI